MKIRKLVGAPIAAALACASIVLAAPAANAATTIAFNSSSCPKVLVLYENSNFGGGQITAYACGAVSVTDLSLYGWDNIISSYKSSSQNWQSAYEDAGLRGQIFNIGGGSSVADLSTHPMLNTNWNDQISSFTAQ